MTREELFADKRFENYNCLLIIGCTDIDEVDEEGCADTAFVLYKDLPMFIQDGIVEPQEFDMNFRKGAKVFSVDFGGLIPDTRNCWTRQEIMDAYKYNTLYCLGYLDNTSENTERIVKVEKTLDDFSYEELAEHLCNDSNFDFLFSS